MRLSAGLPPKLPVGGYNFVFVDPLGPLECPICSCAMRDPTELQCRCAFQVRWRVPLTNTWGALAFTPLIASDAPASPGRALPFCALQACRSCLLALTAHTCPQCRDPYNTADASSFPPFLKSVERRVMDARVRCPRTVAGCDWVGPLREVTSDTAGHALTCPGTCGGPHRLILSLGIRPAHRRE